MLFKKELPWITKGKEVFGLHETKDNDKLKKWLKSDGKTLGDPKALPWCGDYVETCIVTTLPKETLPGPLGKNPYWAKNWLLLGQPVKPCYGAIAIFDRDGGGHVGFLVGEDATDWYVLGGNQSNSVSITRIAKNRLVGTRWPSTYKLETIALPKMSPKGIPKTTNEF